MAIHELKTWPGSFAALVDHSKTFEVRVNDRGFEVGDSLWLMEWDPLRVNPEKVLGVLGKASGPGRYTGRTTTRRVSYITAGGVFGLPADLVVLGFALEPGSAFASGDIVEPGSPPLLLSDLPHLDHNPPPA